MTNPADTSSITILSPPARLHSILGPYVDRGEHDGKPSGEVLATAMGLQPVSLSANWSRAHAELLEVLRTAEEFVRDHAPEYDPSPHARTFGALRQYLAELPLNAGWSAYRRNFEPLVTIALPFSIHAAETQFVGAEIPNSQVADVLSQLDSLIQTVTESDYPIAFRTELLSALVNLRDRIHRFQVLGPEAVKRATAIVVGTLTVNETIAKSKKEIVKETADLISRVADVFLKTYAVGHLLGSSLLRLLPGS